MSEHSPFNVYRLVSGFNGGVSGLVFAASRQKAVTAFCRLHTLYPSQVAVLYCHPLQYC